MSYNFRDFQFYSRLLYLLRGVTALGLPPTPSDPGDRNRTTGFNQYENPTESVEFGRFSFVAADGSTLMPTTKERLYDRTTDK